MEEAAEELRRLEAEWNALNRPPPPSAWNRYWSRVRFNFRTTMAAIGSPARYAVRILEGDRIDPATSIIGISTNAALGSVAAEIGAVGAVSAATSVIVNNAGLPVLWTEVAGAAAYAIAAKTLVVGAGALIGVGVGSLVEPAVAYVIGLP